MVEVGTQDLLCDLNKHLQCCKVGPKFKGQGSSSKFSLMPHMYLHSWEALEVSLGEVKWPESTNDHSWWGRASTKERGERGVSNQDPQNERLRTLTFLRGTHQQVTSHQCLFKKGRLWGGARGTLQTLYHKRVEDWQQLGPLPLGGRG